MISASKSKVVLIVFRFSSSITHHASDVKNGFVEFTVELFSRYNFRTALFPLPEKGKFRSFLLASLKNYLSDAFDRDNSAKRGGQIEFVALNFQDGEDRYHDEQADDLSAEKVFDARWALTLLSHAQGRLRQEYVSQDKTAIIDALQPFLDPTNSKRLPSYEDVADKLQVSLGGVKTLIHRFRKRYSEILRDEVGRTVTDPRAIDDEIHSLCEALIASEGRLS